MLNKLVKPVLLLLLTISISRTMAQNVETNKINWLTLEDAQHKNAKSPKKILIDTYTDWCGWCKRLDATTYRDKDIVEYINTNFYAVKLNAEQKEPITFNGKTYNYRGSGDRGMNEVAIYLLSGQASYPTTVFLEKDLSIITPVAGYMPADQMMLVLKYINKGVYKTVKWETFQTNPSQYIKD